MDLTLVTWLIPVPPLLAFGLIVLFLNRWKRTSSAVAIVGMLLSFLMAQVVFWTSVIKGAELAHEPIHSVIPWLATGPNPEEWLTMGVMVDPLTAIMLFFVSITCMCIFVYSYGYHNGGMPESKHNKKGEPPEVGTLETMFSRFFAYLSLFAAAMLTLVVADNVLLMFVGWEVMGLCSYLLIGFWFARTYPDPKKITPFQAAIKAFMTTRIGDVLMLLGIAYVYSQTGTLSFREIFEPENLAHLAETPSMIVGLSAAGLAGLLLFAGTVGKSSQFPLHVWLPDAMEGPTPVSAMIHAATMVSAGVYAVVRMFPLLQAGLGHGGHFTAPMLAMGLIGAFTALFASVIAVAQNDIKRVLAYSTIAQLGYMIAALGVGAWVAAAFHLVTHAFFKALLFLGSGSVIHGVEHGHHHAAAHGHGHAFDANDMMNMGGLSRKMPVTFWTFLIGGLALSGFPLVTAGFWSKDAILGGAFEQSLEGNWLGTVVFVMLAISALLTAFYTARQISLTFLGKPRTQAAEHASENVWTMTAPLVVLAVLAVVAGWAGIEKTFPVLGELVPNWFHSFVGATVEEVVDLKVAEHFNPIPLMTSLVVALGGLFLGWWVYGRKALQAGQPDPLARPLGPVYKWMQDRFYFDELYNAVLIQPTLKLAVWAYEFVDKKVIDGILHGIARSAYRIGEAFRVFDRVVINGGADALANGIKELGQSFREIQTGRVQNYMLLVLLMTIIIFILFEIPLPGLR